MFANLNRNGRIEAVDLLKLFASVLVILSHCIIKLVPGGTQTPLFNFVWLIQMPLFMFCSGFVNIKNTKCDSLRKLCYRIVRNILVLLVPCFTFLVINCLISNVSIIDGLINFYYDPETNLWFLWTLFAIHLFFDFGLYISSKTNFRFSFLIPVLISFLISLVIVLLMVSNKNLDFSILSLKLIAYYTPFYCFGYLFHLLVLTRIFEKKNFVVFSYCILVLSTLFVLFECFYFESIFSFDDSNIKYIALRVLGSVCSILIALYLADILTKFKSLRRISYFGSFSLQTYYLHILYLKMINFSSDVVFIQWLLCFLSVLILCGLVFASILVCYFAPYLHLVLFGKSFSVYNFEKRLPPIFK